MKLKSLISRIPEGYSEGFYNNRKYSITRTDFNEGKSSKVYAKELGGTDFISLNYYETKMGELLKPCEMSELKVISFLKEGSMPKIGQNVPFNYSSLIFTSFNFSRSNEDLPLCARKSYSPSILICCQVIIELLFIEFNNLSYSFSSFNTDNFCDIVR